jgi:hypothetical protein
VDPHDASDFGFRRPSTGKILVSCLFGTLTQQHPVKCWVGRRYRSIALIGGKWVQSSGADPSNQGAGRRKVGMLGEQ